MAFYILLHETSAGNLGRRTRRAYEEGRIFCPLFPCRVVPRENSGLCQMPWKEGRQGLRPEVKVPLATRRLEQGEHTTRRGWILRAVAVSMPGAGKHADQPCMGVQEASRSRGDLEAEVTSHSSKEAQASSGRAPGWWGGKLSSCLVAQHTPSEPRGRCRVKMARTE